MAIGEKMTGDLATDDFRWRVAKILFEKIFRKLGVEVAKTGPMQSLGALLRKELGSAWPAHWITSAGGILAAAGLQSPRGLANMFSSFTAVDGDKLHELFNEALDAGVLSAVGGLEQGPNGRLTDGAAAKKAEELWKRLEDANRFGFLEEPDVVICAGVIHVPHCTEVMPKYEKTKKQGSSGDRVEERTTFREGAMKAKLSKVIELGYDPLHHRGKCCGRAIQKMLDDQAKIPKDIFACVLSFEKEFEEKPEKLRLAAWFNHLVIRASKAQREKLRDLGNLKVWTPPLVAVFLELALGDLVQGEPNADVVMTQHVTRFLELLETKVERPKQSILEQGSEWLKKNWGSLLGLSEQAEQAAQPPAGQELPTPPDNEVDAVRHAVDRFTQEVRAKTLADADRIRRKRAVWRR